MNKLLNICKNYAGIREDLTEAEEMVIIDLIQTEFKAIKEHEVGKAFKMNASGKYWESVIAYQIFSPIYVGKVLTEYREWKRKEAMKVKPIEPARQLEAPKEDFAKHLEYVKKHYEKDGVLPIANYSGLFKWLEEKGEINLSISEKEAIFNRVKQEVEGQIKHRKSMLTDWSDLLIDLQEDSLRIRSRKEAVRDYLRLN